MAPEVKGLGGLAEWVRTALRGNQALDETVLSALGFKVVQDVGGPRWVGPEGGLRIDSRVTSSIDAAVALVERVLPGWEWQIHRRYGSGHPFVGRVQLGVACYIVRAANGPLALLGALLTALDEDSGVDETRVMTTNNAPVIKPPPRG
jgi:hypothetical protein